MRPAGRGFLKGRNKWVRPADGAEAPAAASAPPPAAPPPPAPAPPASKPLRRIGKHALVRDTPPPKQPPKPAPPGVNKSRFKYVRPQGAAPAAAAPAAAAPAGPAPRKPPPPPPPPHPAVRKPPVAPAAAPLPPAKPPTVRPGKLRWNKYVRRGDGDGAGAQGAQDLGPQPQRKQPPAATEPRRASKRLEAAAAEHRRSVAQRALRATKLLRLGGQLYSVGSGGKKNRSLQLRAVPASGASAPPSAPPAAAPGPSKTPVKPPTTAKPPAAAPAAARRPPPAARPRPPRPPTRLKGGRLMYCPVYCHTGKCPRRGRGCPLRHDPTKRAVCGLWLRGACPAGGACPLQHQRRPELMPACVHFLAGRCAAGDACPFLHQPNLRADAPPCAAFLKGYCAAGAACASKHLTLKQVKEERRLVAGQPRKTKRSKREEAPQEEAAGGDGDEGEGRQRKRRRSRYFDDIWGAGADAGEGAEAAVDGAEGGPTDSSSSGGSEESDDGSGSGSDSDSEPLARRPSSGPQDFIGF